MKYFCFLIFSLLLLGSKLCAIDLDYPQLESLLKLELRIEDEVIDGIPMRMLILEDEKHSVAFNSGSSLPAYFRVVESDASSFKLRGRLSDTVFFDWLSYRKLDIFPILDESSVSAYADALELHLEKDGEWAVEVINEDLHFKYDYGKVVVRPPNREPYEISKKPRVRPLDCEDYFIVDYSLKEMIDERKSASKVALKTYTFRDYLVPYKDYIFIYRVGIQNNDFERGYYEEMDHFVRFVREVSL